MLKRSRKTESGLSLVELMITIAAAAIIALTGWMVWMYSIRQTNTGRASATASRNAVSVLERIEQEVMRAETIEIPDPDYAGVPSMQLVVPTDAGDVRRAFRLEDGTVIVHWKDEAQGQVDVFSDISGLTFTILDSPTNSRVEIVCESTVNNESVEMKTIAMKRN